MKALGNAQEKVGDRDGACASFQQALALDPNDMVAKDHLTRLDVTLPQALEQEGKTVHSTIVRETEEKGVDHNRLDASETSASRSLSAVSGGMTFFQAAPASPVYQTPLATSPECDDEASDDEEVQLQRATECHAVNIDGWEFV